MENNVTMWFGWVVAALTILVSILAIGRSKLERQKLALEVKRLRNSPEIVADRRAIYERLRSVIGEITRDAAASVPQIGVLHAIRHDSEFRFPPEIPDAIADLIRAIVTLHVTGESMAAALRFPSTEHSRKWIQENHDSLLAVVTFEQHLVALFKPHISL